MSQETQNRGGCASWFKWIIGVIIALLAAGGGIVALLNYIDPPTNYEATRIAQNDLENNLEDWINFSPQSLSGDPQEATLQGLDAIDFETGHISAAPSQTDRDWDLQFGCWPENMESLRVFEGVSWFEYGTANFESIKYRDIRDANFAAQKHAQTGYFDLYYLHKGNVPADGFIYLFKTLDDHVVKFQIVGYELVDSNPLVCRNISIRYEAFPVVADPPRPVSGG
ncbi:MAG: hypothetical protein H6656_10870 [Ardenticatenaceae bacterium]|nr:hypothetical protein [Ardenticatenaceae bacterium]